MEGEVHGWGKAF